MSAISELTPTNQPSVSHQSAQTVSSLSLSKNNYQHIQHKHLHTVHALTEKDVATRLQLAKTYCAENGVRFTQLRERIYRLILQSKHPIGAYDLMQNLQQTRQQSDGANAKMVAPPTVYRTLEFLLAQGFIHQLTSQNAYVPCCHPRESHTALFLLCNQCGQVQEYGDLSVQALLADIKQVANFAVQDGVMEFKGICGKCQSHDHTPILSKKR